MWSTVVMQKGRVKKNPKINNKNKKHWIYCSCNWYKGNEQMNHNEPDDNHLLFSANTQSKCQQPWTSCVWLWPMLCQRSIIYRTIRILQLSYYISWQPECTEAWGCFFYSCCDDEALFIQWGKKKKTSLRPWQQKHFHWFSWNSVQELNFKFGGKKLYILDCCSMR